MLKIRFWPALVILIVMAVTTRLGFWQRDRAHQKEALQAHITRYENAPPVALGAASIPLSAIEYHRVSMTGRFLPALTVYLDNRPYRDRPGFYVLTPLALEGGGFALVNRGWLPRNSDDRTVIAPYATPTGEVALEGIARADPGRVFELGHGGSAPHQKIRQNLDVRAYAAETGLALQPFVVQQTSDDGDTLGRDWPVATADVDRNYGYMLQWWGMALAALVFGLYAARRAALKESKEAPR